MSFRKRAVKRQPSKEELENLRVLEEKRRMAEAKGMSVEQLEATEEISKNAIRSEGGEKLPDNFKKMSDMPTSEGIVIPDPKTGEAGGYIDQIGDLRSMEGQLHPATEAWARRKGLM